MDRKIFVFQIGKSLMKNFEILAAKGITLVLMQNSSYSFCLLRQTYLIGQ